MAEANSTITFTNGPSGNIKNNTFNKTIMLDLKKINESFERSLPGLNKLFQSGVSNIIGQLYDKFIAIDLSINDIPQKKDIITTLRGINEYFDSRLSDFNYMQTLKGCKFLFFNKDYIFCDLYEYIKKIVNNDYKSDKEFWALVIFLQFYAKYIKKLYNKVHNVNQEESTRLIQEIQLEKVSDIIKDIEFENEFNKMEARLLELKMPDVPKGGKRRTRRTTKKSHKNKKSKKTSKKSSKTSRIAKSKKNKSKKKQKE